MPETETRITEPVELLQGVRVTFKDHRRGELTGMINGPLWSYWETDELVTYVPVYVHAGDRCIVVDSRNVIGASDD
jgi:hypothetical protein